MVCEPPRQRQLLVSRRGTFFEDPYFRDGWDDYSNAVRRIVDRFNHGWVSPSEKWRDSQYHSMYRTLRTARLNYSTQSARFKEDGNIYKLVMDVKDFVGGDITVRTAGGTVSVRGKLEVKFEDEGKQETRGTGQNDSDDRSTVSGRSSTAKTLHRRFTLPADADYERVESSLSKDAVLTVTIPKRTDVHYIPVTMESDVPKNSSDVIDESLGSRRNGLGDPARQPGGVKRPSDSPHEASRKKSQDEPCVRRRSWDKNHEEKENDNSRYMRRRSREVEAEGKRRRKEEESKDESRERRSRRRDSKYEEVREVNIPIRISKEGSPEKVFRPRSLHEDNREVENDNSDAKFSSHYLRSNNLHDRDNLRDQGNLRAQGNLRDQGNLHDRDNISSDNAVTSPEPQLSYEKIKVQRNSAHDPMQTVVHAAQNGLEDSGKSASSAPDKSSDTDGSRIKSSNLLEEGKMKINSEWKTKQLDKLNSVLKNGSQATDSASVTATPNEVPRSVNCQPVSQSDPISFPQHRKITKQSPERQTDKATNEHRSETASFNEPQTTTMPAFNEPKITTKPAFNKPQVTTKPAFNEPQVTTKPAFNEPQVTTKPAFNEPQVTTKPAFKESKITTLPEKIIQNEGEKTVQNQRRSSGKKETIEKMTNSGSGKSFDDADSNHKIIINLDDSLVPENVPEKENRSMDEENCKNEKNAQKHSLQTPKTSLYERPSSPISPGGRDVPVEKRQSLMEEDMFKDCWSDFSNTLQDVLNRLQELSSELGVSKLSATTPSEDQDKTPSQASTASFTMPSLSSSVPTAFSTMPSLSSAVPTASFTMPSLSSAVPAPFSTVPTEGKKEDGDLQRSQTRDPKTPEECADLPSEKTPSPVENNIPAHRSAFPKSNHVGGAEGRQGGAKEAVRPAYRQQVPGHGLSVTRDLGKDTALSKDLAQTALKDNTTNDSRRHSIPSKEIPEGGLASNLGPFKRPLSLNLRNVASPSQDPSSVGSRPSSLCLNESPIAESLLPGLRKNSPVEALQERFHQWRKDEASRRQGQSDEPRRAVPGGGLKEAVGRPPIPLSPAEEQSSRAPGQGNVREEAKSNSLPSYKSRDVEAEKCDSPLVTPVPEGDQKRKDRSPPVLNDLNARLNKGPKDASCEFRRPNIDDSPESNVTDESESDQDDAITEEGSLEDSLIFPLQSPPSRRNRDEPYAQRTSTNSALSGGVSDVTAVDDILDSFAKNEHPLVAPPSNDVMGCERPLAPSARVPLRGAKEVPHRSNRFQKHREPLILQEDRGDAKSERREADAAMGSTFSRGRRNRDPPDESPRLFKSPSASPSPSPRGLKQNPLEEKPVPPYVRQRTEPSKRYSGFAHVNSDNVRRMRDVWGSRQDARPPASPSLLHRVPPDSPTRTSFSRRTSDVPGSPRRQESPDTRLGSVRSPPPERSRSSPLRKGSNSPSPPTRSPASTSQGRTRFTYPEVIKSTESSRNKQVQKPSPISHLRQGSDDRAGSPLRGGSPAPSSPCSSRKCSQGNRAASPRLSPVEKKLNGDFARRTSEARSSSRGSPEGKKTYGGSTTTGPPPGATRAHQKIFKRLRNASLQPDSEAICFKEEEDRYKMVLDVEEFVPGEIEVLQDERVLTVKGRVETKEGGGRNIIKTFNRTFSIPKNSKEEEIDSALSQDGILCIFVPKKRERIIKIELVD